MRKLKLPKVTGIVLAAALMGGCAHLKGVVVDDLSGRPIPAAVFTVGRPSGVGVSATFHCDSQGRFDFSIPVTDEEFLFVRDPRGDGAVDADIQLRKVDKTEIGTDMKIRLHRPGSGPQPGE